MNRVDRILSSGITLVVLAVFLAIWGLWIGPIRDLPGLLVVALITLVFFAGVVWLAGPHVLPIDTKSKEQTSQARGVLWRFARYLPTLMAVVRDGAVVPAVDGTSREHVAGIGAIDVDSTSVVVLTTGARLSRIEGQGVIFTKKGEKIEQVVDLRIQPKKDEVELITRDGIPVRVNVSARSQIDKVESVQVQRVRSSVRWPLPCKWTPRTVQLALNQQSVGSDKSIVRWDEIALKTAIARLRAIVAEYTFDGLSEPQNPRADPRKAIKERLEAEVCMALAKTGIRVHGTGIDIFFPRDFPKNYAPQSEIKKDRELEKKDPQLSKKDREADKKDVQPDKKDQSAAKKDAQPAKKDRVFDKKDREPEKKEGELDKITQQRISAWQAAWQSRMIVVDAEGKAEMDRRHRLAWSQAQMELIMRVLQALEQGAVTGTDSTDRIALRFLEALKRIATESSKHSFLSETLEIRAAEQSQATDESESASET